MSDRPYLYGSVLPPWGLVRDIARKLPGLLHPSGYYPLLTVHAGSDEIAERSPRAVKRDFRALEWLVDGVGVQTVFSSIPSVAVRDTERTTKIHLINIWMRGWCNHSNFGFFDHEVVYSAPGPMMADGSHLFQKGKWIPSPRASRAH